RIAYDGRATGSTRQGGSLRPAGRRRTVLRTGRYLQPEVRYVGGRELSAGIAHAADGVGAAVDGRSGEPVGSVDRADRKVGGKRDGRVGADCVNHAAVNAHAGLGAAEILELDRRGPTVGRYPNLVDVGKANFRRTEDLVT